MTYIILQGTHSVNCESGPRHLQCGLVYDLKQPNKFNDVAVLDPLAIEI